LVRKIAENPNYFKACVMIGNPYCVNTTAKHLDRNKLITKNVVYYFLNNI